MAAVLSQDVSAAAVVLRSGGLVAFATETVYGLGADALNETAVAGIFEAKGRPSFDPLIVHLADISQLSDLVAVPLTGRAKALADRFWPGPMTLVLPKQGRVPGLVTSGLGTVGIRIPAHPVARKLIKTFGGPVAAPSANLFGRVSPTTAKHVTDQLGERIDFILDGGPCDVGLESTVLHVHQDVVTLLRPGGLTAEDIESEIGSIGVVSQSVDLGKESVPSSPGMLERHYAPGRPLIVVEDWNQADYEGDSAALVFRSVPNPERFQAVEVLSESGNLREAAANLFAAMRRLDAANVERIYAERFPNQGLGIAINDRLRRASATSDSPK